MTTMALLRYVGCQFSSSGSGRHLYQVLSLTRYGTADGANPLATCFRQGFHCSPNHASLKRVHLVTPLFMRARKHLNCLALVDQHGSHSYRDILQSSHNLTKQISALIGVEGEGKGRLAAEGQTIAVLCPNDVSYVTAQWAVWMSGGIAVPLSHTHPPAQLEYFLTDSKCSLILTTEEYAGTLAPLAEAHSIQLLVLSKDTYLEHVRTESGSAESQELSAATTSEDSSASHGTPDDPDVVPANPEWEGTVHTLRQSNKFKAMKALIVYTSGTTGPPKGVVHTYGSLQCQMEAMVQAWAWSSSDVILHVLPLHHVHGIVNCLMTPLYCGATCIMLPSFDADKVWSYLLSPSKRHLAKGVTVFMAVPTVYAKLAEHCLQRLQRGRSARRTKEYIKAVTATKIRLMVSGSASLPLPIMHQWEELTGHRLLERYGMTEIGMALTNPLKGTRTPGAVGKPFPKVEVCIAKNNAYAKNGYDILVRGTSKRSVIAKGVDADPEGDLYVRGPPVFKEYWNRPEATAESFTQDGWFKTGDTASYKDGVYRILGRTSVDIIKTGGYKVSALDVERVLLDHPDLSDVAVVGLPDITWGQKVAAVVVMAPDVTSPLTLTELRQWAGDKLPPYQLPSALKILETMPRNAMGKVNKKDLLATAFAKELKQSTV